MTKGQEAIGWTFTGSNRIMSEEDAREDARRAGGTTVAYAIYKSQVPRDCIEQEAILLEQAWREGWAACRDAEFVGKEAEDFAFGQSHTNSIAIDIEQSPTSWQPIETAPKDNKRKLYLAYFIEGYTRIDVGGGFNSLTQWWSSDHVTWLDGNEKVGPTHWAYQDEPIPQVPHGWGLLPLETIKLVRKALLLGYKSCPNERAAEIRQAVNDLEAGLGSPRTFDAAASRVAEQEPVAHQFKDSKGNWCNFMDEKHYTDTVASGSWEIRSLYTAPTATAWQPIATAPKDMTVVDLWCNGERLTNMRRVVCAPDNIFYEAVVSGYTCVRNATHWMPLPKPPKEAT